MRTVFRVDAAPHIGSGHLARCLTLARQLVRRGASVTFVVRDHEPGWYGRVSGAGLPIVSLPKPDAATTRSSDAYRSWVGVPPTVDAQQTLESIGPDGCDLIIVDHYGLDAEWERQVRGAAGRIMAIEDLHDRRHDVDILLDQNLSAHERAGGGADLGVASGALLGPRYALLDPSYRHARDLHVPSSDAARRVVVYFGGADPDGLTLRTLEVLADLRFEHLEVDVVLGTATAHCDEVESLAAVRGRTRIHSNLPSLAGLLLDCDLAVGGAGATSWERACLGVPSVVVALAANQLDNGEALERAGAARYLGAIDQVTDQGLRDAVDGLVTDASARRSMARRGSELVDGWGVFRVAESLLPSKPDAVHLRPAAVSAHDASPDDAPAVDGTSSFELVVDDLPIGAARVVDGANEIRIGLDLDEVVAGRDWNDILCWAVDSAYRAGRGALGARVATRAPVRIEPHRGLARHPRRVGVVSDAGSWINEHLPALTGGWLRAGHLVDWRHDASEVADSEVCFYLSYGRIVRPEVLARHGHNLVVHASDLPRGRGWSPMTWSILAGETTVTVSLLEAAAEVDAGEIYAQRQIDLDGHELVDQWRQRQTDVLFELCRWAVDNLDNLEEHVRTQQGDPTWLPRRRPRDSELDPFQTIAAQFDLLRVIDNDSYPAVFEYRGYRYRLTIELDGPSGT